MGAAVVPLVKSWMATPSPSSASIGASAAASSAAVTKSARASTLLSAEGQNRSTRATSPTISAGVIRASSAARSASASR